MLKHRLHDACGTLQKTALLLPKIEDGTFIVSLLQVKQEGGAISETEFQTSPVESSKTGSNEMIKDGTADWRHSNDKRSLATESSSQKANCQQTVHRAQYRDFKSKHKQRTPQPLKIPPDVFKKQLSDTSDILSPLTLLPNTKRLLEISTWNFNTSLTKPERPITSGLSKLLERNCISNEEENEFDTAELNLMPLGYKPPIDLSKIKRITRKRKNPYLNVSQEDVREQEWIEVEVKNECLITDECNNASIGYVEAVYDTDSPRDQCFFLEGHEGQETAESAAYAHRNIDVLLAAAAENNTDPLLYCHESQQMSNVTRAPNPPALEGKRVVLLVENSLGNISRR